MEWVPGEVADVVGGSFGEGVGGVVGQVVDLDGFEDVVFFDGGWGDCGDDGGQGEQGGVEGGEAAEGFVVEELGADDDKEAAGEGDGEVGQVECGGGYGVEGVFVCHSGDADGLGDEVFAGAVGEGDGGEGVVDVVVAEGELVGVACSCGGAVEEGYEDGGYECEG